MLCWWFLPIPLLLVILLPTLLVRRPTHRAAVTPPPVGNIDNVSVTISAIVPDGAPSVSPALVGLSIEQDRWTDWVGTTSPNRYFLNLLENLKRPTGYTPDLRIGANSEDRTDFRQDIESTQLIFPDPSLIAPYPEARIIIVGDAFYQAVQFLPPNTRVIWGLNLADRNLTSAFLSARSIVKAFSSSPVQSAGITLEALEIGNEPDLYSHFHVRPPGYTIQDYIQEWTMFATNISQTFGISPTSHTRFWALSFAHSYFRSGFSIQSALANNLAFSAPGAAISVISQHHYSGTFCRGSGDLLQNLMSKSSVRSNLSSFIPDIQATRAANLEYVLGETNSFACHGAPSVSNVAGAALWALDYTFYATQVGITRLFYHHGIGFKYNMIQPVTLPRSILDGKPLDPPLPPHVQGQYYAAIIAAEAIGPSNRTRTAEIVIGNPRLTGYAFYEGQKLVRALFINLEVYLRTTVPAPRNAVHLDLTFVNGTAPAKMEVKRLAIGHADDTKGLSWGGQNYETADGTVAGKLDISTVVVSVGVDISATEAVMLSFV